MTATKAPTAVVRAIRTYLGHTAEGLTFSDGSSTMPAAQPAKQPLRTFVEQDRMQTLLDRLRTSDYQAAAGELIAQGHAAIPALVASSDEVAGPLSASARYRPRRSPR